MNAAAAVVNPTAAHGWRRNFQDLSREHGFEPLRIEGTLPQDVAGTLYRTGPSLFSAGGRPYQHWFDGDGAVSAVRFSGGKASGAVKLVQSDALVRERATGKARSAGYGTLAPGLPVLRALAPIKNAANTSVIVWQGRVLALNEGNAPVELSPEDLATLGETRLEDVIVAAFSAHPHRVPSRKTTFNHGLTVRGRPMMQIYALPDEGPARLLTKIPMPGPMMLHDSIATESHLIYFVSPIRMQLLSVLAGLKSFGEALEWRPQLGTEIIVVPIDRPGAVRRYTVEPFYQWHFANAFDEGGAVVVDYVRLPDFRSNEWLGSVVRTVPDFAWDGRLHRARLDLATGKFSSEELSGLTCEFPRVGASVIAKPHRYVYAASHSSPAVANGLFDEVAKFDLQSGKVERVVLGEQQYPSEPVFVRRDGSGEDAGYLLTLVYDALTHESHVAVLDAARPSAGPIARAHFGHAVPFTFHGNFARG